jgi:hypothetical protein
MLTDKSVDWTLEATPATGRSYVCGDRCKLSRWGEGDVERWNYSTRIWVVGKFWRDGGRESSASAARRAHGGGAVVAITGILIIHTTDIKLFTGFYLVTFGGEIFDLKT